jgi:hypothetical protein
MLTFIKKVLVIGMIAVGFFIFPEASQALRHYCFGDGSQLNVDADYIKNSPVVKKHLAHMKVGEKHKVGMHQWEDWRLSFAINPFTIEKRKDKVIITQWMQFAKTDKVVTWFGPIPIPDNIVHTFKCTPYMFHCEWKI